MIPNTSFAVANVQVSQLPIICKQIEGYFQGGANAYLQVHDSCIAPATGAVPKWQMPLNATAQFQQTMQVDELVLSEGLFVGVSSTDGTWTASASTMNVTVWTNDPVVATNVVGDKTTTYAPNRLQIWAQGLAGAAEKRLYCLLITEKLGTTQYVYASPADVFSGGASVIETDPSAYYLGVLPANGSLRLYFASSAGLAVTYNNLGVAIINGMTIAISSAAIVSNTVKYSSADHGATICAITN